MPHTVIPGKREDMYMYPETPLESRKSIPCPSYNVKTRKNASNGFISTRLISARTGGTGRPILGSEAAPTLDQMDDRHDQLLSSPIPRYRFHTKFVTLSMYICNRS